MSEHKSEPSSGNVYRDLGFNEEEANRLLRESDELIRRKYAPAITREGPWWHYQQRGGRNEPRLNRVPESWCELL